jgi:hypothetical protein
MARRRPRAPVLVPGAIAAAALAIGLSACGSSGDEAAACAATKALTVKTVPALERRFDVAELIYDCRGSLATADVDRVQLTLAGKTDFSTRARLAAAVRAGLTTAGWSAGAGSAAPTARQNGARYSATVTARSVAPALATLTLANADPSSQPGGVSVTNAYPEKRLTGAEKRRYVTVPMFVPAVVPPGYARWGATEVLDYDDVDTVLAGGRGKVAPELRSTALPAGWSATNCDVFTSSSRGDRCVLWATTPAGIDVYLARNSSYADGLSDTPVAVVDGTLVSLLYGHNHTRVRPAIARADVLRIFDSLRARNTPAKR